MPTLAITFLTILTYYYFKNIFMKNNLLLLIAGLMLLFGNLNAQIMYSDDFESYTTGQGIALQEGDFWDT